MEQITMVPVAALRPHEKNPRIDAAEVADLVESIREHGIEVPLVVTLCKDSELDYTVLAGHRRLTAALQVGLEKVPAQIREDLSEPRDQLAFMATENIHRDQLTAVEEARLVQDMLDLGLTQAEVAKQTALGKKRVAERVKLTRLSEDAGSRVHRGQISIEDALVIAEYSDDPDTAAELEQTAGTYNFDWATSRAKARREAQRAVEAARKEAKKRGLRIVDEDADFVSLDELYSEGHWPTPEFAARVEGATHEELTEYLIAEHESCPGHCVRVLDSGNAHTRDLLVGCDQVLTEHHIDIHGPMPGDTVEEAPTPPDPWEDITAEDFAAAAIHREQHLARTLPHHDFTTEAREHLVTEVLRIGWTRYGGEYQAGIAFLEAITGAEGKERIGKVLEKWPLPVLVCLAAAPYELPRHHADMAEGARTNTAWGAQSAFRQLLETTGYEWTDPEQKAILLATGTPHDASDTDGADDGAEPTTVAAAALAEEGEAA